MRQERRFGTRCRWALSVLAAAFVACCAVAWFLLVGRPPFVGESVIEVCSQHLHVPPAAPSLVLGKPLPGELEALVLRCLAKEPEQRPRSARELRRELVASRTEETWSIDDSERWWRSRPERPASDSLGLQTTMFAQQPPDRQVEP